VNVDVNSLNDLANQGKARLVNAWRDLWLSNVEVNMRNGAITEASAYKHMHNCVNGGACVIAGPGPSLDDALPFLAERRQNVIAVNSALNPLLAWGVQPGITVCCHPEEEQAEQMKEVAAHIDRTAVLCVPVTIHPRVVEEWAGRIAWFQSYDPAPEYAAIRIAIWAMLGDLNGKLGYTVAGGGAAVTALEVAFHAGFREFFFVGFELGALPKGVYYGARYDFHEDGSNTLRYDCRKTDIANPGTQFAKWRQSTLYRLAFEQRLDYFASQDDKFRAWNLSPYSFLECPCADMAHALGGSIAHAV
jgi:hypothetical protein